MEYIYSVQENVWYIYGVYIQCTGECVVYIWSIYTVCRRMCGIYMEYHTSTPVAHLNISLENSIIHEQSHAYT